MGRIQNWGYNDMPRGWLSENKLQRKIYDTWYDMIKRCYSDKYHKKEPTYKDCYVCERWRYLSNFVEDIVSIPGYKEWSTSFNNHMSLDKDIIVPGNREYAPDKVCFVSIQENNKERNNRYKYDIEISNLDGEIISIVDSLDKASKIVGRSKQTICDCMYGRQNSTNGFKIKRL